MRRDKRVIREAFTCGIASGQRMMMETKRREGGVQMHAGRRTIAVFGSSKAFACRRRISGSAVDLRNHFGMLELQAERGQQGATEATAGKGGGDRRWRRIRIRTPPAPRRCSSPRGRVPVARTGTGAPHPQPQLRSPRTRLPCRHPPSPGEKPRWRRALLRSWAARAGGPERRLPPSASANQR